MTDERRQEIKEYIKKMSGRIADVVAKEMDENPKVKAIVEELRGLGVVCTLTHDLNVRLFVNEHFVPPSNLTDEKVASMFTDEDQEFLRSLKDMQL